MGNKGTTLNTGDMLYEGDYLQSDDGLNTLVLGDDGNVSLYWRWLPSGGFGYRVWQSGNSDQGPHFLVMQGDGNLCCYAGIPSDPGPLKWQSGAAPGYPSYRAVMQGDGNFCVYPGSSSNASFCTGCAKQWAGTVSISTACQTNPTLVLSSAAPSGGPSDALSMQWGDTSDRKQQFRQINLIINNQNAGFLLEGVANNMLVAAAPAELSLVKFTTEISLDSILIRVDSGHSPLPRAWTGLRPLSGNNNHFNVPGDSPYKAGSGVIMYHWADCGNTGVCYNLLWNFSEVGAAVAAVAGV